jgi:cell division protein ZapA
MPQVTVTINGRAYPVACDAGQESRIAELARYLDGKVAGFARQFSQAGEARLVVLAALVIADELAEANDALHRAQEQGAKAGAANGHDDAALAGGIERLARRVEAVAARLETPHI